MHERDEVVRQIDPFAIGDHVSTPVQIPPAVLVHLHILAGRRLADGVRRAEQTR